MSRPIRVARDHDPGHIGNTPQNTGMIPAARVDAIEAELVDGNLPPHPRVDAYMAQPPPGVAAVPGLYRQQATAAHIQEAIELQLQSPPIPTVKNIGGTNLFGDF